MPHQSLIRALDLVQWASTNDARLALPQLVRRLILAQLSTCRRIEFPAYEQTDRSGYDGILEASTEDGLFPSGTSVWEMGVSVDPQAKANKDFNTRKKALGIVQRQATFVSVTLRKWEKREDWAKEKRALNIWKDVRVFDCADLEQWLELAPAVDLWLAERLGKQPSGVRSVTNYWESLQTQTRSSIKPEIVLCGRDQEFATVLEWLEAKPSSIIVKGKAPLDGLDFICAAIQALDPIRSESLLSRSLIIDNINSWRSISSTSIQEGLVLLADPLLTLEAHDVATALRNNHYVLLSSLLSQGPSTQVQLNAIKPFELSGALKWSGFTRLHADELIQKSRGRWAVLKRLLTHVGSAPQNVWVETVDMPILTSLVLAGKWDQNNQNDLDLVAKLTNLELGMLEQKANYFTQVPDPALVYHAKTWAIVSRQDCIKLIENHITRQHLQLFKEAAQLVLGEDDPLRNLPYDEKWNAALRGVTTKYSSKLRQGIADSVAFLSWWSEEGNAPTTISLDIKSTVREIVTSLLQPITVERWSSLSEFLTPLAEAAPEIFLQALEKDLGEAHPQVFQMFQEGDLPSFFSSSPHTGLLSALEVISWNARYLYKSSSILARLAKDEPGGRLLNRPMRSLIAIYIYGMPQTSASNNSRIQVLRRLAEKQAGITGKLLLQLLPMRGGAICCSSTPRWKAWHLLQDSDFDGIKNYEYLHEILKLLLEIALYDYELNPGVAERIDQVSLEFFALIETHLKAVHAKVSPRISWEIHTEIVEKLRIHKDHPEAEWALPVEHMATLESLVALYSPKDPGFLYAALFSDNAIRFVDEPFAQRTIALNNQRQKAIEEILELSEPFDELLQLAINSKGGFYIGQGLGELNKLSISETLQKISALESIYQEQFLAGYAYGSYISGGSNRLKTIIEFVNTCMGVMNILMALPFTPDVWKLIDSLSDDVQKTYWEQVRPLYFTACPSAIVDAIDFLMTKGRPDIALINLSLVIGDKSLKLDPDLLIKVLGEVLSKQVKNAQAASSDLGYGIRVILETLEEEDQIDPIELANLEFKCLALLNEGGLSTRTLRNIALAEPETFIQLVALNYRPESEDGDLPENSEEKFDPLQAQVAKNAFSLLRSLWNLPGLDQAGQCNDLTAKDWVTSVRALAKEQNLLQVTDILIGEIIARKIGDMTLEKASEQLFDLAEYIGTSEVESGLYTGLYNYNGSWTKRPYEGGEQERALGNCFKQKALEIETSFPVVGAAFNKLADDYLERAANEDDASQLNGI